MLRPANEDVQNTKKLGKYVLNETEFGNWDVKYDKRNS